MRILLVDTTQYYPLSPLFLEALEELQAEGRCTYSFFDEGPFVEPIGTSFIHKVAFRLLGRRPLAFGCFNANLKVMAAKYHPDLLLVVKGAYISPRTLEEIKSMTGALLVNYATDDPFNPAVNTQSLIRTISQYDIYACTKKAILEDVHRHGARHVLYVPFGYKPSVHFPERQASLDEKTRFQSDVVFIGSSDQDRVPFLEALIRALPTVRVHLYGGYWEKHPTLRKYHKGFATGRDYRLALGGTKIVLNFVRHSNRDDHSMRIFEIPACHAFMLAERTNEHLALFREGSEMACFSSPQELVDQVQHYLSHESEREQIANAGHQKIMHEQYSYKDRINQIFRFVELNYPSLKKR